jgi:tRNA threonylcarbamoyladenosine biosynthesis protein TsaE
MRVERAGGELVVEAESEADTERLGQAIAAEAGSGVILALVGPLGSGKTRLTRAIAEALGVDAGAIASPTFVLVHEYEGRMPVVHCDAYRLPNSDEFEALGVLDSWGGQGLLIVEWADRVADCLPRHAWTIRIEPSGTTSRRFLIELPPDSAPLADRLTARLSAI